MRTFHIRTVDSARHSGDRAPKAPIQVAYIPRPYKVCVPFVAALDASERALRPPILLVDQVVLRTLAAGVPRIDIGNLYIQEFRFVRDE